MGFLDVFKSTNSVSKEILVTTDMHSHLIPGVDDGVATFDDSIQIIKEFYEMGYRKIITTPHVMSDYYPNSPQNLKPILAKLKERLLAENLDIEIEVAAEYYVDETFQSLINSEEELLTFGLNYILIETAFMNKPPHLDQVIFELQLKGLKPILAHPERYIYMYDKFSEYEKLYEKGVLFQLNLNSLVGYYSPAAKKIAEKLIKNKMVDFVGSDCHHMKHIEVLKKVRASKLYSKLAALPLKNNTL